ATTPIRTVDGWRATKARAAVLAASIRVGFTSAAAMLFEVSMARITVPSRLGVRTVVVGRASATINTASATAKKANGTWRRHLARPSNVVVTNPWAARPVARADRRRRIL